MMFQIPLQAVSSVFAECLLFKTVDVGISIDNPEIVLPTDVAMCGIAVYYFIQKNCSYVCDDYDGDSFIDDTWCLRVFYCTSTFFSIEAVDTSRRAFKRRGFLELREYTQQAIPITPISGGHSMAEDNLLVYSRLESSSGSVIRWIIAHLCVISPFRRPRPLGYRPIVAALA